MRRARRIPLLAAAALLVIVGAVVVSLLAARGPDAPLGLDAPHFSEEAAAAGIVHAYAGDFTYFVGGGVAAFDCDDDGRQDLYLAGGAEPAALYRNDSETGAALRFSLLRDDATDLADVTGAYPLDIDSDGRTDLAVMRVGENVLLRGLGECRFERANEAWGFDGGEEWSAAFSATWEGEAALPTLAVGNYLKLNADGTSTFDCEESQLFRPAAGAVTYDAPKSLSPSYCPLSMLFSDWDRSGRRDLRVSNDRHYYRETSDGEEQLWRMKPGEEPALYSHQDGWQTVKVWGMGIASYDLTGDGYPEVYLTSQGDNKLQTLADGPERPDYTDIALRLGVTAHRPYIGDMSLPSTAWHAEFADLNNDGLIDLFVSKGNVNAMEDFAARDPNDLLIGQLDGTFTQQAEAAGIASFARSRGAAIADFNLDGLLDLVVVNRMENMGLWRNLGSGDASAPAQMGNWVALRLDQPGPNRDAIGAWVEVNADGASQTRELTVGGGHVSGELGWIHFGIGAAETATVTVTWPDGSVEAARTIAAKRFALVHRGQPEPELWSAP